MSSLSRSVLFIWSGAICFRACRILGIHRQNLARSRIVVAWNRRRYWSCGNRGKGRPKSARITASTWRSCSLYVYAFQVVLAYPWESWSVSLWNPGYNSCSCFGCQKDWQDYFWRGLDSSHFWSEPSKLLADSLSCYFEARRVWDRWSFASVMLYLSC